MGAAGRDVSKLLGSGDVADPTTEHLVNQDASPQAQTSGWPCPGFGHHERTMEVPRYHVAVSSVPAPTVERQGQRSTLFQATCVPTATATNNSREGQAAERSHTFFLGGRLVPAHLQAELRKLFTNSCLFCRVPEQSVPSQKILTMLEGPTWEAFWSYLNVPETYRRERLRRSSTTRTWSDHFVSSLFLLIKPAQESFHTRQYDT